MVVKKGDLSPGVAFLRDGLTERLDLAISFKIQNFGLEGEDGWSGYVENMVP